MKRKLFAAIFAVLLAGSGSSVRAESETAAPAIQEDSVPTFEPIVISATRLETPARELASSVTVITRKEIEASQKSSVAEVLRGTPALDVVRGGGPGGTVSLFTRGADSRHTLVLIDGIEAGDPSSTDRSFDLGHLSVDNVERIEIIRGPQSTLYGSDAMGGVVNVITRKGAGRPKVSLLTEGGTYRTARTDAGLSGGTERMNYAFQGSRLYTGSFTSVAERLGASERDGYGNSSVSGRIGFTPTGNTGVDVTSRYTSAQSHIDASGADDPNYVVDSREMFTRAQGHVGLWDGLWENKAGASLTTHDRQFDNPVDAVDPVTSNRDSYDSRIARLDWQSDLRIHRTNTLTVGAETERDSAEIDNVSNSSFGPFASHFAQKVARTNGYYFQDQIKLGNAFFATLGARSDQHDRFGSAGTYRVTTAYWFQPSSTKLKATYGTGFKAPSLFQLYSSFGDPNLKPEESIGWDAGFEQLFSDGKASIGATYFANDFNQLIDYDNVTSSYKNIEEASSNGVEILGSWRPVKFLSLKANHTVTDTEDKSTGLELLRRAKNKSGASAALDFGKGDVNLSALYVGKRTDLDFTSFPSSRVKLPSYTVLNLGGSLDVLPHLNVFARLENVLDKKYEEILGYGSPRRGFYAGVKATF